jgi:uncharacterized membrane protein YfcA
VNSEHGALIALFGFVGGIGITGVGPGGILITIGLYTASGLTPPAVAGTGMVVVFGAGVLGSTAYLRSGYLNDPPTRRLASLLALAAILGPLIGVLANAYYRRTYSRRFWACALSPSPGCSASPGDAFGRSRPSVGREFSRLVRLWPP